MNRKKDYNPESSLSRTFNILTVIGLWWMAVGFDKLPGSKNSLDLL